MSQDALIQERSGPPPTRAELSRGTILVLGLGRAGINIARFLLRIGARVIGYDEDARVLGSDAVRALVRQGLKLVTRPLGTNADWVVVSPGIAEEHKLVRALRRKRMMLVDELDLASQLVPGPVIGITGSNGKSTTTALIAEMLKAGGKRVFCGGNLAPGRPLSSGLRLSQQDYYVVEVSSFQLERARWFAPKVAVILNVTAEHLNRHGTFERYAECKFRILDRQTRDDFAVLNLDDPIVVGAQRRGRAQKYFFAPTAHNCPGAYLADGGLWWRPASGTKEKVAERRMIRLRGRHNVENVLAAICTARLLGIKPAAIRRALVRFKGLEHRLELVRVLDRVEYVNNSMCTNSAAGIRSLEAFEQPVILIAGGREKGLPVEEYVAAMTRHAKWVLLVGENRHKLARSLSALGYDQFELCADLPAAVLGARRRARPGDVVLFSPGFASFDQFRDFQERGKVFKDAVGRLS